MCIYGTGFVLVLLHSRFKSAWEWYCTGTNPSTSRTVSSSRGGIRVIVRVMWISYFLLLYFLLLFIIIFFFSFLLITSLFFFSLSSPLVSVADFKLPHCCGNRPRHSVAAQEDSYQVFFSLRGQGLSFEVVGKRFGNVCAPAEAKVGFRQVSSRASNAPSTVSRQWHRDE